MSTYTFKLVFEGNERAELSIPFAHLAVKTSIRKEGSDERFIGHQCAGPHELEAEVLRLKAELDQLLSDGKRKFAKHRREISGRRSDG